MRRLESVLTTDTLSLLDTQGYVVVDDAFPSHVAQGLRSEILSCYTAGAMSSNSTAFVSPPSASTSSPSSHGSVPHITRLISKPNIHEAEVLPGLLSTPSLPLPLLSAFSSHLLPYLDSLLCSRLPHLLLFPGLSSLKLQVNAGRGCFPFHYDSPGNLADTRRLTLLLYLNPAYLPSHGGHLLLRPFLGRPVSVHPTFNRLLLFRSDRMLHRVTVSGAQRCCLTVWLHGRSVDVGVGGEKGEGWMHAGVQRGLSKCVYEEEWRESYREAHGGEGGERLSNSVAEDVRRMMEQEGVRRLVELMKDVKREQDAKGIKHVGCGEGDVKGGPDEEEEVERAGDEVREKEVLAVREVATEEMGFLDFL